MKQLIQFLNCYFKKGEGSSILDLKWHNQMQTVGLDLIRGLTYPLKKMTWKQLEKFECALDINDVKGILGFPVAQLVKNPPAKWETRVRFLGWEDPLEKG